MVRPHEHQLIRGKERASECLVSFAVEFCAGFLTERVADVLGGFQIVDAEELDHPSVGEESGGCVPIGVDSGWVQNSTLSVPFTDFSIYIRL